MGEVHFTSKLGRFLTNCFGSHLGTVTNLEFDEGKIISKTNVTNHADAWFGDGKSIQAV